jgi:hypothetical protein
VAVTLGAALDAIRAQIELPRAPTEQAFIAGALKSASDRLSPGERTRALDAAELMTLEQATELAREV